MTSLLELHPVDEHGLALLYKCSWDDCQPFRAEFHTRMESFIRKNSLGSFQIKSGWLACSGIEFDAVEEWIDNVWHNAEVEGMVWILKDRFIQARYWHRRFDVILLRLPVSGCFTIRRSRDLEGLLVTRL